VPRTKADESKLVEITEARKKALRAGVGDEVLAVTEENSKFGTKFPSWTSPVRPRSPAPKFLRKINYFQVRFFGVFGQKGEKFPKRSHLKSKWQTAAPNFNSLREPRIVLVLKTKLAVGD